MKQKIYFSYLFRKLRELIFYPRKIVKRYKGHNGGLGEMIYQMSRKMQDTKALKRHRALNSKLINIFIILPFFIGLLSTSFLVVTEYQEASGYLERIQEPIDKTKYRRKTIKNYISFYTGKIVFAYKYAPLKKEQFYPLFIGYLICFFGAFILSKNPIFVKEEKIKVILSSLKYVDLEGRPWRVLWSPTAIMFEAFNADPTEFCLSQKGKKFWNSIQFTPGEPIQFSNNLNKFIVQKRYELPSELIFNVKRES